LRERARQRPRSRKTDLKLGFIKLTDCVPLVIAKEKGYFEDEGLFVTLEAQANWKILLDRVISGELDGAHMLAGQPIGATIGIGTKSPTSSAVQHGSERQRHHGLERGLGEMQKRPRAGSARRRTRSRRTR
jgi:ABC-type nitrate/sulfonate/bicarbonate transport system substrate-binding protein